MERPSAHADVTSENEKGDLIFVIFLKHKTSDGLTGSLILCLDSYKILKLEGCCATVTRKHGVTSRVVTYRRRVSAATE